MHFSLIYFGMWCCRALWESCQQVAAQHGGRATLLRLPVRSLEELEVDAGPHAAIIVAAGAAMGTITEMRAF